MAERNRYIDITLKDNLPPPSDAEINAMVAFLKDGTGILPEDIITFDEPIVVAKPELPVERAPEGQGENEPIVANPLALVEQIASSMPGIHVAEEAVVSPTSGLSPTDEVAIRFLQKKPVPKQIVGPEIYVNPITQRASENVRGLSVEGNIASIDRHGRKPRMIEVFSSVAD